MVLQEVQKAPPAKRASSLKSLGSGYAQILPKDALAEDLKKSGLDIAHPWLDSVCKKSGNDMLAEIKELRSKADKDAKQVQAIKLPSLKDDAEYRKVGLSCVSQLASLTSSLEGHCKKIQELRSALQVLKSTKFSLEGEAPVLSEIQTWEAKVGSDLSHHSNSDEVFDQVQQVASFHVTAVAAMCLVQSDRVKAQESKAVNQLADIVVTLEGKHSTLPKTETELVADGAKLLEECQQLAKKGPKHPGNDRTKQQKTAHKEVGSGDAAELAGSQAPHGQKRKLETPETSEPNKSVAKAVGEKEETDGREKKEAKDGEQKEKKEKTADKKEKKEKKDKEEKKDKKSNKEDKKGREKKQERQERQER